MYEVNDLSFRYSRKPGGGLTVSKLTFAVRRGTVFGLAGHNGAGKTTLLKLLARLLVPESGNIRVDGNNLADLPEAELYRTIGLFIEKPGLYGHLSLRDNLRVLAAYRGIDPKNIAGSVASAGLEKDARKLVRNFSTGMRQRAGLAAAMLHDPDLLILDEPTMGLDPEGIREIRNLIRRYADGGKTVILSSHILGEIEQACDDIAVMKEGSFLFVGSKQTLRHGTGTKRLYLRVDNTDAAETLLKRRDIPFVRKERAFEIEATEEETPGIVRLIAGEGIDIYELSRLSANLEEVYFTLS